MKYKVGDKVRIKSLDWYNENKDEDEYGNIPLIDNTNSKYNFIETMQGFCGKVMTISSVSLYYYDMVEDNGEYFWTNEMIEGLVEEESSIDLTVKGEEVKERIEIAIPEGYEYVIESGKIIFTKKKPKYPQSYEECCYVLGFENTELVFEDDYRNINPPKEQWKRLGLMNQFNKLLVCRDAYWKIAGEEMGLGKPWEPDYKKERYVIHRYIDEIVKGYRQAGLMEHFILEFPTEEMRDAFYENFKNEIEQCKELL